jgi:hypothetical protein
MRFACIHALIATVLVFQGCVDENSLTAAYVEYDSELFYVDAATDSITLSYDPRQSPDVEPIANIIVCGALEIDKSYISLRDFADEGDGETFQLQATLVIDALELPLFTWSGTLTKGSKPLPLAQPAANLSSDAVGALNDLLPGDDPSYKIRYDFTTASEQAQVQFQVVHRILMGTTVGACNSSDG